MSAIGYYIFYCVNWVITLLPLPVLYIFSDIFYPFVYYLVGYRRKVVRENLKNSFPEKNDKEIISIEKKFYHHLCDLIIETLKLTHMSNRHLMKRLRLTNPELMEKMCDEGRDIVAILGHHGNWEWLRCLPLYSRLKFVSVYKPIQNKHFEKFMNEMRSKNGIILTPLHYIVREIVDKRKKNIRTLYAFISDQTPPGADIKYWTNFLNQDTPVFIGAEKIASKYDMAVIFFNFQKTGRGLYEVTLELLFNHAAGQPERLITDTHVKRLEERIRENPEYWVWSHKRWKYKREHSDA
jgi:KDO2-lipid IV(A) lauroyltransferase